MKYAHDCMRCIMGCMWCMRCSDGREFDRGKRKCAAKLVWRDGSKEPLKTEKQKAARERWKRAKIEEREDEDFEENSGLGKKKRQPDKKMTVVVEDSNR